MRGGILLRWTVALASLAAALLLGGASAQGAFPGANGQLVFDGDGHLVVANADGSGLRNLTSRGGSAAAWSPDGTKIAFFGGGNLNEINFDGTGRRIIAAGIGPPAVADSLFFGSDGHASRPSWSPDGTRIVFATRDGISIVGADGTGRTRIADGLDPTWSPDGKVIAFARLGGIWLADPNGENQRPLMQENAVYPSWSPDGHQFLFVRRDRAYLADSSGGGERLLGTSIHVPTWSPDGSQIMFTSGSSSGSVNTELWVMRADGTERRRIGYAVQPDWQRCGRAVPCRTAAVPRECITVPTAGQYVPAKVVIGTAGADVLRGSPETELLCGLGGSDRIVAGDGVDAVFGGAGSDRIDSGAGDDLVVGGAGNDVVSLGPGRDEAYGNRGSDSLSGGAGNDVLSTIDGVRDRLNGGPGRDCAFADRRDVKRSIEVVRRQSGSC